MNEKKTKKMKQNIIFLFFRIFLPHLLAKKKIDVKRIFFAGIGKYEVSSIKKRADGTMLKGRRVRFR